MSHHQRLESLFRQIRDICAQEYKRGEEDARARIIKAASSEEEAEKPRKIATKVVRANTRKTAKMSEAVPRGLPERFVRRVLSGMPNGISPTEIITHATSSTEKRISYSAIRQALNRGKKSSEYRNEGGKWYKS
jgi:hypothetical protein